MANYNPSPYEQYLALQEGKRANPIVISSDESSDDGGVNNPNEFEETTTDSGSTSDTESEGDGHDSTQAIDGEGCSRDPPPRNIDTTSSEGGEQDQREVKGANKKGKKFKQTWVTCGKCGARFLNNHRLGGHYLNVHGWA